MGSKYCASVWCGSGQPSRSWCPRWLVMLASHQGCGSAFIWYGSGSGILGWIPIRIQYRSGSGSNQITRSRALMTKNWKKFTAEKRKLIFLDQNHKECRFQVTEEAFSLNTSKHEIFYFFLLLWVIFALLDPDPDSGSTDLIESGSNWDPDPQPCFSHSKYVLVSNCNCNCPLNLLLRTPH